MYPSSDQPSVMAERQTHLNGASHRHRHRPDLIFKIVVTGLAVLGFSVFVVLLVFTPKSLKIHVTHAFLAQFNLTTNNTLYYNLALKISIENPNKRIGLYYDNIQANDYYGTINSDGYYAYHKFGTVSVTPFYQGYKNTSVLSPVFHGHELLSLETSELSNFSSEKSHGVYSIDVDLNLTIRAMVGRWIKIGHFEPVIMCGLMVPLSSNGKSAASFSTTECELYTDHMFV
ncbi:hypothetical protein FH972_017240 [Carpinus fangiana]|uniref:Uncharacterized protein n=1 Tax=Carpinus fangiana TaxID=176857 RepID=A0A5N6RJM8_9ROSI|nr:hypothetical protein FH972_017240 [Carpinus fangiana]